jgi:hypothetical protein
MANFSEKPETMKNLLLFLLLTTPLFIIAQVPCRGDIEGHEFNVNKIQTYFLPQGQKFQSLDHYGFHVPYPPENYSGERQTISAGAPWIGGYSDGKLHIAGQLYLTSIDKDYFNGPLDTNGMKYEGDCHHFDRVWNVFREDVLRHQFDFQSDGIIDDTINSVFGWPAEGNPFFERFNGFPLPTDHNGGWADFVDINFNGKYDPHQGEYPVVRVKGIETQPDQIMWMVFNDQGSHTTTNARPLGIEIQSTYYGYFCQDNTLLNHSLFNTYKIINQSEIRFDSLYFGQFHDYEIGCDDDDYIGCDTLRNTEFAYNADNLDGYDEWCNSGATGYGPHLPIQSLSYLSHPMFSFIKMFMFQAPQTDLEFYRLMTGRWRSGAPITTGGTGQGSGPGFQETRFIYHDDPRDPDGWSELTVVPPVSRARSVSSVYLDHLEPGDQTTVELVYMFHQDTNRSHLEQFDVMYENLDLLDDMLADVDHFCDPYPQCVDGDCVWPGDFNRDGIVDQRDLLHWATSIDAAGPERNGLISWRGHFAEDWAKTLDDGTNVKHLDANGNGAVNMSDLNMNLANFSKTTTDYKANDKYPGGPELVILSDPMDSDGNIGNIRVMSRRPLKDMYGIAFEFEFDTFYYTYTTLMHRLPLDESGLTYIPDEHHSYYGFYEGTRAGDTRYSFVGTNQENYYVQDSFYFMRIPFGLKQKHQVPLQYLPDQFVFRLKNLIAINKDGEDLDIGSVPHVVYNPFTTAVHQPETHAVKLFPNPSHDAVMIVSERSSDVEIVDLHGRRMRTILASELSSPVDIADLMAGMYFLRFIESGKIVKLIVQ